MCAYVTNNHISETLDATPEMANNAVSDLMTFIDNVDQVQYVLKTLFVVKL